MRIIAGQCKGCALKTREGKGTRPTDSRSREMLFNILRERIIGARAGFICGQRRARTRSLVARREFLFFRRTKRGGECHLRHIFELANRRFLQIRFSPLRRFGAAILRYDALINRFVDAGGRGLRTRNYRRRTVARDILQCFEQLLILQQAKNGG